MSLFVILSVSLFVVAARIGPALADDVPGFSGADIDPGFYHPPAECDEGEVKCGDYMCYIPGGDQTCYDNKALCEEGESPCGWSCYDPEAEECLGDGRVCDKGSILCGWNCVEPSPDKECLTQQWGSYYCDKNSEALCGSWGCYTKGEKVCYEEQDLLCDPGLKPCGKYDCYDEGKQKCVEGEYGSIVEQV